MGKESVLYVFWVMHKNKNSGVYTVVANICLEQLDGYVTV